MDTSYLYEFKSHDLAEALHAYLSLPINFNINTGKPILYTEPEAKSQSQILTYLINTYGPPVQLRPKD